MLPVTAAGVTVAAPGAVFASVDAVAALGSVRALLMIPVLAAIQLSFGGFENTELIKLQIRCPSVTNAAEMIRITCVGALACHWVLSAQSTNGAIEAATAVAEPVMTEEERFIIRPYRIALDYEY